MSVKEWRAFEGTNAVEEYKRNVQWNTYKISVAFGGMWPGKPL
jgi:hypothetical protein